MEPPKDTRADALLQTKAESDPEFEETMWLFRNPDKGGKKVTLAHIRAVEIPMRCGFTVSLSTLHGFYKWLELRKRWQAAEDVAAQARAEMAKDPDISDKELDNFAERVLKTEAVRGGNVKGYVALGKLQLSRTKLNQDARKLQLLERKAEFADEVKKVAANREGGITAEEMADIERRLKLM